MKLELKHIAPYLPYGLNVQYEGTFESLHAWIMNYLKGDWKPTDAEYELLKEK